LPQTSQIMPSSMRAPLLGISRCTGTHSCGANSIEHDKTLGRVMTALLRDDTELFKQFMDNEGFKRWMTDTVFGLTYPD